MRKPKKTRRPKRSGSVTQDSPQLFASRSSNWCTPREIWSLIETFVPIGLDPCGSIHSEVPAKRIILPPQDGLKIDWSNHGHVYLNPPYGKNVSRWAEKASWDGDEITSLYPARIGTAWFQRYVWPADVFCSWKGRLRFVGATTSAPFDSVLVYRGEQYERFRDIFATVGECRIHPRHLTGAVQVPAKLHLPVITSSPKEQAAGMFGGSTKPSPTVEIPADIKRGCIVIASVSGGKDSAAMCLWLKEQGIEHERVFMDTGWEADATYEYIRETLEPKLGPIKWLRAERQMEEMTQHKGMFPSRTHRFCTQELKVFPIRDYLDARDDEFINAVGIRADESTPRSKTKPYEWNDTYDCYVWRPMLRWTKEDVINIHKRHGLAPNPLYLLGSSRVGCWPCIFVRKAEMRLIAEKDPGRIQKIRDLEAKVTEQARQRYAARGETFESLGYGKPAFFLPRLKSEGGVPWPIDRMVEWSRTDYGGNEIEIDPDEGCLRWGLCEGPE